MTASLVFFSINKKCILRYQYVEYFEIMFLMNVKKVKNVHHIDWKFTNFDNFMMSYDVFKSLNYAYTNS